MRNQDLFWASASDISLFPALGRLVGNDALTGDYSSDGLAASCEVNDDFTEWTFHLHPEAEWHFGFGPVTAADVIHSYELHTGDDVTQTAVAQLRGADAEAIDVKTLRFTFEEPRVNFLFAVANRGSMLIYSKAQRDAEGIDGYVARPAGTEHYQVVERASGQYIRFERVDDHWSGTMPPSRRWNSAGSRGLDQARRPARGRTAHHQPAARAAGRCDRARHEGARLDQPVRAHHRQFQRPLPPHR